jgi:hypothetical protein
MMVWWADGIGLVNIVLTGGCCSPVAAADQQVREGWSLALYFLK